MRVHVYIAKLFYRDLIQLASRAGGRRCNPRDVISFHQVPGLRGFSDQYRATCVAQCSSVIGVKLTDRL